MTVQKDSLLGGAKKPLAIGPDAVKEALAAARALREADSGGTRKEHAMPAAPSRSAGVPRPGGGKRVVRMPGASRRAR